MLLNHLSRIIITMTVATSFLVSVCSVPVHAGDIKPDSRKLFTSAENQNISP